jgi:predicted PurR-regulated permease PerM
MAEANQHEHASTPAVPEKPVSPLAEGEPAKGFPTPPIALLLIAIVLMIGVVTYLGPILKPFLVAVFLFFSTNAATGFFIRRGFPPMLAYLTLFVVGSVAVTVIVLLAYSEAVSFREAWPEYQQRVLALVNRAPSEAGRPLSDLIRTWSREASRHLFERGISLLELLMMTLFYLLFILLGAGRMPQRVRRAFPDGRGDRIVAVAGKIGAGIEQFMQVKTVVSLGMGASAAALMFLFGLRSWPLWGILFFVLNYITYIGSILACVPPVVVAFLDLDSPLAAMVLAGLIVLNRFVWIDYIEIKMAGRQLNIESILLFLWLAYWGWVWGVVGLILSFPMITSVKIILENVESTRGWAVLMSEE